MIRFDGEPGRKARRHLRLVVSHPPEAANDDLPARYRPACRDGDGGGGDDDEAESDAEILYFVVVIGCFVGALVLILLELLPA